MTIKIGNFAKNYIQSECVKFIYSNENGKIYSIKLPFGKFILLTIEA